MTLPYGIGLWENGDLEQGLVVIVWMLSGGYHWNVTLNTSKDTLCLQNCWPKSATPDKLGSYYEGQHPGDSNARKTCINKILHGMTSRDGSIKVDMFIPLHHVVTKDPPILNIRESIGDLRALGPQFKSMKKKHLVFDRFLVIDLKLPTDSAKKEEQPQAIFLANSQIDLSDSEEEEEEQPLLYPEFATPKTPKKQKQ